MVIGETGMLNDTLTHSPQTVVLSRHYVNPVVFAKPVSRDGGDTSVVRITDVQADRFTLYVHEAPNKDGPHTTEAVSYLVLEAGRWELLDGTLLEVGTLSTDATVGPLIPNVWEQVDFSLPFSAAPVVVSQVQTNNDAHWVKSRQYNATAAGVYVALQEEDANTAPHGVETIGWLAMEAGQGSWNGHAYEAAKTADAVTHVWYQISFGQSFGQAPRFIAALATYDGGDSSHLRYNRTSLTASGVQVKVEEDTTYDSETNHTTEVVSYLAIQGDGTLTGQVYASSGSSVTLDVTPLNYGVACQDGATGSGYIMYSEESVHTRFSAHPPLGNNADHFVCVIYDGNWKYDNNSTYYVFTPRSTDILVAEVDFSADTVTDLVGQDSTSNGIAYGYASGDLTFEADKWNGSTNDGEFYITGTSITTNDSRMVITKYYYAAGQRVAMRRDGVVYYLHTDHLGSTSLTTDDSGELVAEQRYYPYGEVRWSNRTLPTDRQFTGQRREQGLGLYDYRARYYDPFLGRFISADTIVPNPGNPQDLNRYSYVRNSPLVYIDPSGHVAAVDQEGLITVLPLGYGRFSLVEHPAITERSEWLLSNWVLTHDPKYYAAAVNEGSPATGCPWTDSVRAAEIYADHDSAIVKMGSWPIYYQGVDWEWLMDTSHGGGILAEVYRQHPELFWTGMVAAGMVIGDTVADELVGPYNTYVARNDNGDVIYEAEPGGI